MPDAHCPECPAAGTERHATSCRTGYHPGAVVHMAAGYPPHAYRPDCGCPVCVDIRTVTDRATVARIYEATLGHPDWAGRATISLKPQHP